MDAFLERNGITKSWLAEGAGIAWHTFVYALAERGFTPAESDCIEGFLNESGELLSRFAFSSDSKRDLERLRRDFGIKKAFLEAQLGFIPGTIYAAAERAGGFRADELEVLRAALKDISRAMTSFRMPGSLLKKAA